MKRSIVRSSQVSLGMAPVTLVALALTACAAAPSASSSAEGDDDMTNRTAAGDSNDDTVRASTIPLDAQGCLDLSAHHPKPIPLKGRLVVTYFEPSLDGTMCDWDDETSTYWCPSETATSPECADVIGTLWCPVANPPAERLGDAQELASFDLTNPAAGTKRWTTNYVHEAELDISPDGKKVVYAVRQKMDAFEDGMGIWVSDSDGKNARKVIDQKGHTGIPTWLPPHNDKFTYIADGLKVFDMATSTSTNVTIQGFDAGLVIDPEASHDGKRLTFKADASGGNVPNIYVMDFDGKTGSNLKQLTRGWSDHDPVFSLDNQKIYFERYYGPGEWDQFHLDKLEHPEINAWGIVEVDAQTGKERVLIPHDKCGKHFFWLPTISPDGKHIMFIHDYVAEDGYQDLWVADANGENAQPVPNTKGFHWFDWAE